MILSDVSIKRPVFTTMMSLCLLVLGYMGLTRLGTDLYPDVTFPVVVVNTVYKGAGPGEVETQVVKPIEDAVAGISGVDNVVRPMLISRGSSLPFLLTLLGVLGGVIAFGFIGLFIGPTLLAVGYSLLSGWTHTKDPIVKQKGAGL